MNYFKSFFKISIILILLIITVGSIYAADNADSTLNINPDDDFGVNEDIDDDFDDDSDDDEDDSDEDSDDDEDDSDDDDVDDEDDSDDDDLDDEDDLDDDDFNESVDDFEFLEFRIMAYLEKYGNCTDENWTESADFLNEYQIYLSNPSSYTLNESAEGYETYLKIYNSTVSTFGDYNLTENETAYLKFLIIYYLNHYGNVSANYTWNESDEFSNFPLIKFLSAGFSGYAPESMTAIGESFNGFNSPNEPFPLTLAAASDLNKTAEGSNATYVANEDSSSWWATIIIIFLVLLGAVLLIRRA